MSKTGHRIQSKPVNRRRGRGSGLAAIGVAAALPVVGFLSSGAAVAAEPTPVECGNGAVFIAAGTNDPDHVNTRLLEERYALQGYVVNHVAYPATFWPLGAQSYDANIETGKQALTDSVIAYQEDCPGEDYPVVIVGYSQGARIAGDVLEETAQGTNGIDKANVTGELYSDPRRTGSSRGAGAEVNFAGAYPGVVLDGARDPDAFEGITVYSVCIDGDPVCDLPDPLHDPIGAADALLGFFTKHATYGSYMAKDPASYADDIAAEPIEESSALLVMIYADPALTTILDQVGLPNLLRSYYVNLPYPNLADLQPIAAAILNVLPTLPELGHGAYLTDVFVISGVLQRDSNAWQALLGSAISVVRYPVNFVYDWTGALDDLLDGTAPDFDFIASATGRDIADFLAELLIDPPTLTDRNSGVTAVMPSTDVPVESPRATLLATSGHNEETEQELRTAAPADVVSPVVNSPSLPAPYGKHAKPEPAPEPLSRPEPAPVDSGAPAITTPTPGPDSVDPSPTDTDAVDPTPAEVTAADVDEADESIGVEQAASTAA